MMLTLLGVIYLLGVLWLLKNVPSRLAVLMKIDDEKTEQRVIADISGDVAAAFFWPIILVAAIVYALANRR